MRTRNLFSPFVKRIILSLIGICWIFAVSAEDFPGQQTEWNGFTQYTFDFAGRQSIVVTPHQVAEGKPWIWRPAFFGHEPQADLALLDKGWHVVYYDLTHLYGSPRSIALGYDFYRFLTDSFGFSKKTVLEGFSRGGLFVFNWAAQYPDKVACIYADAPVCDFKSWPAQQRKDTSSDLWKECLAEYGLTAQQAWNYPLNPVDNLYPLAQAGIPIIAVCGDADDVVPYKENMGVIRTHYAQLGGYAHVILKPRVNHHPHSLKDPKPIVDFIMQHNNLYYSKMHIQTRGTLNNCRIKFIREKKGRVAFMGGSITEMKGWRDMICMELQNRFPETEFEFIDAGIASTGTTPGAFRFKRDVWCNGSVDLLFEEAAVNDETNGFSRVEQIRGMEGIVRQARMANPDIDIVMLHFIWDGMLAPLTEGKIPDVITNHEKVADYYQIPSINLALEVSERMQAGEFDWNKFGGTHPAPFGHKIYVAAIGRMFDSMWNEPLDQNAKINPHILPVQPLDKFSYFNAELTDIRQAKLIKGWKFEQSWQPSIKAETRKGFVNVPTIEAQKPGAQLSLRFKGKAVGIFHVAGPDAGIIEYSIDGKPYRQKDLFTKWSRGLYIPWVTMFETELDDKEHVIQIRTISQKNENSIGYACQIFYFLVN